MEEKTDAVVLRSVDYKDNDRILTLFSADKGKITAGIKGVRKNGARLRFASEIFSFCEYVYVGRNGRNTVTSAYLHDGFFDLRTDIEKYYSACAAVEVADAVLPEGAPDSEYFFSLVGALKEICYGGEKSALVKFLYDSLVYSGFCPDTRKCGLCGGDLCGDRLYFDFSDGKFFCAKCRRGVAVSGKTYSLIKIVKTTPADKLKADPDAAIRALRLLKHYLSACTESEFPSLSEYIRIAGGS